MEQEHQSSLLLAFGDQSFGALYCEYLEHLGLKTKLVQEIEKEDGTLPIVDQQDAIIMCFSSNVQNISSVRQLREYSRIPVFVILAEDNKEDIITCYESGADDVSIKPISPEILACKIKVLLKRLESENKPQMFFEWGAVTFDAEQQLLTQGDTVLKLSGKETEVLQLLAANANQTIEKGHLLRKVWKADNYFNGRSLSVYINHLRNILKDVEGVKILSIHGKGYKLVVEK